MLLYFVIEKQMNQVVQLMSDSVALWTIAHQAPLSMGFFWASILDWVAFPSPEDLPDSGIKPVPPTLAAIFFTTEPPEKLFLDFSSINY